MSALRFAVPEFGRKRGASTHLAPDTQNPHYHRRFNEESTSI
jgi:hypothetical protein